jgi:hypothetical protein
MSEGKEDSLLDKEQLRTKIKNNIKNSKLII